MIKDGQEHVCNGCYEIIATHEPEAYQRGTFYYHSEAHEDMHASRNWDAYARVEWQQKNDRFQEMKVGT